MHSPKLSDIASSESCNFQLGPMLLSRIQSSFSSRANPIFPSSTDHGPVTTPGFQRLLLAINRWICSMSCPTDSSLPQRTLKKQFYLIGSKCTKRRWDYYVSSSSLPETFACQRTPRPLGGRPCPEICQ